MLEIRTGKAPELGWQTRSGPARIQGVCVNTRKKRIPRREDGDVKKRREGKIFLEEAPTERCWKTP